MKCSLVIALLLCVCQGLHSAEGGKQDLRTTEDDLLAVLQHYMVLLQNDIGRQQKGQGLTLDDRSEERVEGTYVIPSGRGVYFLSENDDNGRSKLLITTMDGVNLIYVLQLRAELTFISVGNDSLLYYSTEDGGEIYRVLPSRLFIVLNAVRENTDFEVDLLRTHLPRVSEEEGTTSLGHLLDLPDEIQMLIDAAKKMADEGMTGEHSPALRILFVHILNLEWALWEKEMKSKVQSYDSQSFVSQLGTTHEASAAGTETCTTFPTTCPRGRCPYERSGNRCFGMCGRGCTCWRIFCGDCCTHRGCIEHDACCARSGFRAFLRCWAPLDFRCDRPFRC